MKNLAILPAFYVLQHGKTMFHAHTFTLTMTSTAAAASTNCNNDEDWTVVANHPGRDLSRRWKKSQEERLRVDLDSYRERIRAFLDWAMKQSHCANLKAMTRKHSGQCLHELDEKLSPDDRMDVVNYIIMFFCLLKDQQNYLLTE